MFVFLRWKEEEKEKQERDQDKNKKRKPAKPWFWNGVCPTGLSWEISTRASNVAPALMALGNQQPTAAGDNQQSVRKELYQMLKTGRRPQVADLRSALVTQILFHSRLPHLQKPG